MRPRLFAASIAAIALSLSGIAGTAGQAGAAQPSAVPIPPFTDVPEYRADNRRTGQFAGPGPVAEPVQVWSRTVDGSINYTPQIADGKILFGASDSYLYALDARTGAEDWRFKAGDAIVRFGSAADGTYVFSSGDGVLHALDLATGQERWNRPSVGVGSDIEDGVVYVPGSDDHAYGLDLATGKEVWSWAAPANVYTLSVADGTAYASVDDGRFYAISIADSTEQWHFQTIGPSQGISVIGDDRVFVSTAGTATEDALACDCAELDAVDRASGTSQWKFNEPTGVLVTPGAVADGVYFEGTIGDGLYAFPAAGDGSGATPKPIWHAAVEGGSYRNEAVSGDTVYVPLWDPNSLMALDASDGTVRWNLPLAGHPGGTLVSGGMVFVADDTGTISAYAEPDLAAAIGPVTSGSLNAAAPVAQPPDPFTIVRTLDPATTGLQRLLSFDVGPDGLIYALDNKPSVTVIDPTTGSVVTQWGRKGTGEGEFDFNFGEGIALGAIDVSPDGIVVVSDSNNHRLQEFSADGTFIRQMGTFGTRDGQLVRPREIAIDGQDSVYVVDTDRASLTKFDRDGAFVWHALGTGAGDKDLQGIFHSVVAGEDGHLVLLREGGPVLVLDAVTGSVVDRWGNSGPDVGDLGANCELGIDGAGNDYVFSCAPVFTQVFNAAHQLIAGAYAPRDQVVVPVFGPDDAVYGHDPEFSSDNIYILKDSLLPEASPSPTTAGSIAGTWHSDKLTEDQIVSAWVAAGGAQAEGHDFFAQLGGGANHYAIIGMRFFNGNFTEFESADGKPEVVGARATFEVAADGILTLTDRDSGDKGRATISFIDGLLSLPPINPCTANCHPYGILWGSFRFHRDAP